MWVRHRLLGLIVRQDLAVAGNTQHLKHRHESLWRAYLAIQDDGRHFLAQQRRSDVLVEAEMAVEHERHRLVEQLEESGAEVVTPVEDARLGGVGDDLAAYGRQSSKQRGVG